MFINIKLNEFLIFAKLGNEGFITDEGELVNPISKDEIIEQTELIDDLFSIMKSKSLLNKKRGLRAVIDGRLALSVCPETVRVGGTNHF